METKDNEFKKLIYSTQNGDLIYWAQCFDFDLQKVWNLSPCADKLMELAEMSGCYSRQQLVWVTAKCLRLVRRHIVYPNAKIAFRMARKKRYGDVDIYELGKLYDAVLRDLKLAESYSGYFGDTQSICTSRAMQAVANICQEGMLNISIFIAAKIQYHRAYRVDYHSGLNRQEMAFRKAMTRMADIIRKHLPAPSIRDAKEAILRAATNLKY